MSDEKDTTLPTSFSSSLMLSEIIKFRLHEYGFVNDVQVRAMAIAIAADVKRWCREHKDEL